MLELLFLLKQLDDAKGAHSTDLGVDLHINDEVIVVPLDSPTCKAGVVQILTALATRRHLGYLEQEPDKTWAEWLADGELDDLYVLIKRHLGAPPEDWWAKCQTMKAIQTQEIARATQNDLSGPKGSPSTKI